MIIGHRPYALNKGQGRNPGNPNYQEGDFVVVNALNKGQGRNPGNPPNSVEKGQLFLFGQGIKSLSGQVGHLFHIAVTLHAQPLASCA